MNDYEILLMLDPETPEERHNEIIARTRETIEKGGGNWLSHDAWGRQPEHREAQAAGMREYYDEYSITVGTVERASAWQRAESDVEQ